MMPGYKNLSVTRLGGRRQTFCPKKEDPFHLPCQRFSDTEFFLMIFSDSPNVTSDEIFSSRRKTPVTLVTTNNAC
jgi:hypothetical protein